MKTNRNGNNDIKTTMKRTKEDIDYLRFKGHDIIECRQQYNKYAGDDEQRISQKICDMIAGLSGAEIGCLHMFLEEKFEILGLKKQGFTDTEIDMAIDAARKRREKVQARASA